MGGTDYIEFYQQPHDFSISSLLGSVSVMLEEVQIVSGRPKHLKVEWRIRKMNLPLDVNAPDV